VLPDFFIGAHAATSGWPLMSRDRARFTTYFPGLRVIAPDS
jgi:predicted nucleic acid-binding protein